MDLTERDWLRLQEQDPRTLTCVINVQVFLIVTVLPSLNKTTRPGLGITDLLMSLVSKTSVGSHKYLVGVYFASLGD